jgi:uncharacterized coiled-coil protein SlyX
MSDTKLEARIERLETQALAQQELIKSLSETVKELAVDVAILERASIDQFYNAVDSAFRFDPPMQAMPDPNPDDSTDENKA